ncbi:unnamed protein product [Nippostrongylus brasiliensis]|uniref:Aps (inferred by orthology to a D. melanogaster protein) n=1 Tax=Nippostrongylus brasiliensis TaxID=27835 RepID=A0A0N4XJL1_NIPBR|nr:unnamed protein product [Nippostrongylus brasiliensis]
MKRDISNRSGFPHKRHGKDAMVLLVSGGKEGGKWVIPGGGVEQNECAEEAARRELEEEAGVKARAVEVIGLFQASVQRNTCAKFVEGLLCLSCCHRLIPHGNPEHLQCHMGFGTNDVTQLQRLISRAVRHVGNALAVDHG